MNSPTLRNNLAAALLTIAGMTTGCKRLIEIPANPPTAIAQSEQFSDSMTTMTAMADIYSYPSNGVTGFTFNDGYLSVCSGLSSDELTYGSAYNSDLLQYFDNAITPLDGTNNLVWGDMYVGIYPVNAALSGIASSTGLSASLKTQLTGELKVVRALYYFELVNMFGGVPLVTTTQYADNSYIPRTSADSIYLQIIDDLTAAQQALPTTYPASDRYRPNLYTVKTLLSKVYLYRQQWQAAYDAADTVIRSGVYSMEPDLNNVFLDGSQEAIWQLPANGQYLSTIEAYNYVPSSSGTIPAYPLTSTLINAFESGDQRFQKWIGTSVVNTGSGNQNEYYPYKYKNLTPAGPTTEDFMIFRLGEVYLIRAEAAAQLGDLATALSDLNTIRARAGLPPSTAATQADILTAILHERQTELFCEWGDRWQDLKRTGTANTILGAEKPGWQSYDALYPIPFPQQQVDNLLKQNPGYN